MLQQFVIFTCIFIAAISGKCLKGCVCTDLEGKWAAICENVPPNVMASQDIQILQLLKCPTKEFSIPKHMEMKVLYSLSLQDQKKERVFQLGPQATACNYQVRNIEKEKPAPLEMDHKAVVLEENAVQRAMADEKQRYVEAMNELSGREVEWLTVFKYCALTLFCVLVGKYIQRSV